MWLPSRNARVQVGTACFIITFGHLNGVHALCQGVDVATSLNTSENAVTVFSHVISKYRGIVLFLTFIQICHKLIWHRIEQIRPDL